jgi:hypothetical protein
MIGKKEKLGTLRSQAKSKLIAEIKRHQGSMFYADGIRFIMNLVDVSKNTAKNYINELIFQKKLKLIENHRYDITYEEESILELIET